MRSTARFWLVLAALGLSAGCDSCQKKSPKRGEKRVVTDQSCVSAAECDDGNSCTVDQCDDGECIATPSPEGTSCDNDDVCDGVSKCDGNGKCVAGAAPVLDDENACTVDTCDPVTGVRHEPVAIDDFDACTRDACDPRTGVITHDSIEIDDGDDCTFDSCDKQTGVKHQRPNAFYSCESSCGTGFHPASRAKNASCGGGLQTFCAPDCGASFYVCDLRCPSGYHASSRAQSAQCGEPGAAQTFCQKDSGEAFYSCDAKCPSGYLEKTKGPSAQCGEGGSRIFCVKS